MKEIVIPRYHSECVICGNETNGRVCSTKCAILYNKQLEEENLKEMMKK